MDDSGPPSPDAHPAGAGSARLGRAERRERLLDAAGALVDAGPLDAVSMEAVAERAGVSRPLLYKHFANRNELLGAVYQREAAHLHDQLTAQVSAADSLEEMYRALVRGVLRAADERGHVFAALRSAGAWTREVAREQRARDRWTSTAFADRAVRDLGIERRTARAGTAMLLSLVDPVLAQWNLKPTPDQAILLEETFMTIVAASLKAMAAG